MTTALQALDKQLGNFKDPSVSERGAEEVDVSDFLLNVQQNKGLDINIAESITGGYIERTMEGASSLQVVIHDPRNVLMESDMFGDGTFKRYDQGTNKWRNEDPAKPQFTAIDVQLDGLWFRLAQISKSDRDITLTFEDRIVALLRLNNKPRKATRSAKMTRAEFIKLLVDEVKRPEPINFFSPELKKVQPTARREQPTDTVRRHNRSGGLLNTTDLTVKHQQATKTQLENLEAILDTGTAMGANYKCLVAAVMVAIQESDLDAHSNNAGVSLGLFNQQASWGSVKDRYDPVKTSEAFFRVCIKNDRDNPNLSAANLGQSVQHSGAGASYYASWENEAKKIVKEYGAQGGGSAGGSTTSYKPYEFHRGPPDGPHGENTWDCTQRLAQEVNWRRFVVGNTFFYVQDADLMKAKPIMTVNEDDEGIEQVNFDIDSGKPVNEATVTCRADRWFAFPGEIVVLEKVGPANGRWLVWTIHRDLFTPTCEVTLRQPESAKPEPAPQMVTTSGDGGGSLGGKGRDGIVAAAKLALSYGPKKYHYAEVRPMPKSLFGKGTVTTDCSGFATLCYKAGGAPDPNGFHYNGSGFTGTLLSHGHSVSGHKLRPADLVFYSSPDHVAVYIGNGKVIEFGGQGGPHEEAVNYRSPTAYRTYDTGSGGNTGSTNSGGSGGKKRSPINHYTNPLPGHGA